MLPHALAEAQKTSLLYLCRKPETSSLLIPNSEFLGRFPDSERFDVLETANVDCLALDSLQITKVDFLKIDIQGAENDVLKGASSALEKVLGVEIEVEFLDLYRGQPLFGEVCTTLAEAGFEFFDFVNLQRWERSALRGYGQCVFGDALFLKTPEEILLKNPDIETLSTYISILTVYRRFDLIDTVLNLLPQGMQPNFQPFELFFARVKRRDAVIRKLHSYLNQVFSLLGSETRLHLMR